MSVRRIARRLNRKTGDVAITFEVSPEMWQAMAEASRGAFGGNTLDYVAGTINTAFLDIEPIQAQPANRPTRTNDMDDDIPF